MGRTRLGVALGLLGALSCSDLPTNVGGVQVFWGPPGASETHAVITVRRGTVMGDVTRLKSLVTFGSRTSEQALTQPGGGPVQFPATYVVVGKSLTGTLNILLEASDGAGSLVGRGRALAVVIPQRGVSAEVVLSRPCVDEADCNDRDSCTGLERCDDGVCAAGEKAPQCDDVNNNPNDGCQACAQTAWTAEVLLGFGRNEGCPNKLTLPVPYGVAVDRAGNLFVSDWQGNRVWRLDVATHRVTAFAGTGQAGYSGDGLQATVAQLSAPQGIGLDARENLYIAEAGNHTIRRVDRLGIITTVAGNNTAGDRGDGEPAVLASLNQPVGVRVDGLGNIFIADNNNNKIRRVGPEGIITTFAGGAALGPDGGAPPLGDNGPATSAVLSKPSDVAVDTQGNVFIADSSHYRIRKVAPDGIITTIAGTGSDGIDGEDVPADSSRIGEPWGLFLDPRDGSLVVAQRDHRVRVINPQGRISTLAGTGIPGSAGDGRQARSAQLNYPAYVAVTRAGGVYVSEEYNQQVRYIAPDGVISPAAGLQGEVFAGGNRARTAWLQGANGVAIDAAGNLYVPEYEGHRIRRILTNGDVETYAGTGVAGYDGDGAPANQASINVPDSVLIDRNGDLVFTDSVNNRIRKVDHNTRLISTIAGTGVADYNPQHEGGPASNAYLNLPAGLAQDAAGNLYVSDAQNFRIRKIDTMGNITTVAGNGDSRYGGEGLQATASSFTHCYGIDVAPDGTLFIADDEGGRIWRVGTDGVMNTIMGDGNPLSDGDDGPAILAHVSLPGGVLVAPNNVLYVADTDGARVRRIDALGRVTHVAGDRDGHPGFWGDTGPATEAQLNKPYYMARDSAGNLYIADYGNSLVRKVAPDGTMSTAAGSVHAGDGPFKTAALVAPTAMAVLDAQRFLVADGQAGRVRLINTATQEVTAVAGYPRSGGAGPEPALDSRHLYNAAGVAYDARDLNVYVSERDGNVIRRMHLANPADPATWTIEDWAGRFQQPGRGVAASTLEDARFAGPAGLVFDAATRTLLVADARNHGIRGILVDEPGSSTCVRPVANRESVQGFLGDNGPALEASFDTPEAVALGANGLLYVADTGNHRVRVVTHWADGTGTVASVLGDGFPASSGQGSPARFFPVDTPLGVAVDAFGNVFVTSSQTVRVISPAPGSGSVLGGDRENVQTVYGVPPRGNFPESITRCLSGMTRREDDQMTLLDACQGLVVTLTRRLARDPAPQPVDTCEMP